MLFNRLISAAPFAFCLQSFPALGSPAVCGVPKSQSRSKSVCGCSLTPMGRTYLPVTDTQPANQRPPKAAPPLFLQGPCPQEYLMVTRGSWVTPHTMEAWVPLMTLWSCGGLVMRVRAERQQRGGRVGRGPRRTGEMQVCVAGSFR